MRYCKQCGEYVEVDAVIQLCRFCTGFATLAGFAIIVGFVVASLAMVLKCC